MATEIRWRRGTSLAHSTFTGAAGEITVDTTKNTAVVHDGSTLGGTPLATEAALEVAALDATAANTVIAAHIADTEDAHDASAISSLPVGNIAATNVQTAIGELDAEKAPIVHGHAISAVSGLQTALDGKASVVHTHAVSDVTGLQTSLDSKVSRTAATGSAILPVGTEAQRDTTPQSGYLRFNSDTDSFEGFNGTEWGAIGGGATGGVGNSVFYENDQLVTADYSITANKNAMSAGPIEINTGVTVTVPVNSVWSIV